MKLMDVELVFFMNVSIWFRLLIVRVVMYVSVRINVVKRVKCVLDMGVVMWFFFGGGVGELVWILLVWVLLGCYFIIVFREVWYGCIWRGIEKRIKIMMVVLLIVDVVLVGFRCVRISYIVWSEVDYLYIEIILLIIELLNVR